jgi:hypothetical protein
MLLALLVVLASPSDWVPARWRWLETKTLELLTGTPVNCLLIEWKPDQKGPAAAFSAAAADRGIETLAVIRPGGDAVEAARNAMSAKLAGVVLEGDFPTGTAEKVSGVAGSMPVIELASRNRMKLDGKAPIIGTYQGVWPGIQLLEDGAAKAGPSGSPWINTNAGFLRAAGAFGNNAIWIANLPPPKTVINPENYLQAIGDAAMVGARWVIALDDDFAGNLFKRDAAALKNWQRMAQLLKFYDVHREWRAYQPAGKLAVIQSAKDGALLSGGILDMIAARHTPVRAVPPERLKAEVLKGATMAVDVDAASLTPQEREVLKQFTRAGGTLLTAPPGWNEGTAPKQDQITLDEKELKRLDDIWHDVQSMIGRSNLGARLFNVSSMLSNLLSSPDGKQVLIHLVNYANYPVESVTVHVLGDYKQAWLYTPEGTEKKLDVYKVDEGTGIDIEQVSVTAVLRLE